MESGGSLCSFPLQGLASRSPLSVLFLRCCCVPPSHFVFGRPPTSSLCPVAWCHGSSPLPTPTPPLLCTCFGTASFGNVQALCFWRELAVAVLRDGAVLSWQLVGRWSQVAYGTPETGQCGEEQRVVQVGRPAKGPGTSVDAPGWLGLWEG